MLGFRASEGMEKLSFLSNALARHGTELSRRKQEKFSFAAGEA
jgi:hypothetical protein